MKHETSTTLWNKKEREYLKGTINEPETNSMNRNTRLK
jgi:hypothetical protein